MKFSKTFENFLNFQKSSKYQNLSVWGIVSTEKSVFFETTKNLTQPEPGLAQYAGATLAIFEAGGSKKSKKCEIFEKF